jgi:hypothetical protein
VGVRDVAAEALHHLGLLALEADGDLEGAWHLNAQSLVLYRHIGDRHMLGAVLAALGRVARARGDATPAHALLAEAVTALGDPGDVAVMRLVLSTWAALFADLGQCERAVRLAAAAARLDDLDGSQTWPTIRRERDAWLNPVRCAMRDDDFARAWAEGHTMTPEQAVAYALAGDQG